MVSALRIITVIYYRFRLNWWCWFHHKAQGLLITPKGIWPREEGTGLLIISASTYQTQPAAQTSDLSYPALLVSRLFRLHSSGSARLRVNLAANTETKLDTGAPSNDLQHRSHYGRLATPCWGMQHWVTFTHLIWACGQDHLMWWGRRADFLSAPS